MLIDTIINESLKIPNISETPSRFSRTLCYQNEGETASVFFYSLFPGISVACISAETKSWPLPDSIRKGTAHRLLLFCYCFSGRCKICLNSRDAISIGSGEMAITSYFPENEYIYPLGKYEGIVIIIDLDETSPRYDYFKRDFGIEFSAMADKYFSQNLFYAVPNLPEYKEAMKILWDLHLNESRYAILQMKVCVMSILLIAMHIPSVPMPRGSFYLTAGQAQIAERVHAIVSVDLSRRYSARELASRFGISETSLKNYFKNVYGKSFAAYLREARMQKGAELLKNTAFPVSEIAAGVGYASPSKFSDVFKKQFGIAPLEYRRLCNIKNEP